MCAHVDKGPKPPKQVRYATMSASTHGSDSKLSWAPRKALYVWKTFNFWSEHNM